jgi:phosphate starvation-inducible PhoH-like protein
LYDKAKIDSLFTEGKIEIIPFAFMRGRNFSNAFIILDEAQNVTDSQMEMAISRLCEGSKMVIVGDVGQIDLRERKDSGLIYLNKAVPGAVKGVASIHLSHNHRHPIVEQVINVYKQIRN